MSKIIKMKAAIWTKYGSPEVLKVQDIDTPIPKEDEILIKIVATSVFAGDCEMRRFDIATWVWLPLRLYIGIFKPRIKILGQECSGVIISKGEEVNEFNIGDEVIAMAGMSFGTYAEYKTLSHKKVICLKPPNISFEKATTIPTGGINALHFIKVAKIKKGERLLLNGAGGSIGTFALQLAKIDGAHVTCVDSADKLEMLSNLGADDVIDYMVNDFTLSDEKYDIIIDIVGKSSFSRSVNSLNPFGRYILGNPSFSGMIRGIWTSKFTNKSVIPALAGENKEDLQYLIDLVQSGRLKTIIDKSYQLEDIIEAHQYVEQGLKKGHLVIKMPHS